MEQTQNTNAGKGMGIAGFIIAIVAVVFFVVPYWMACAAAIFGGGWGVAIFWTVVSVLGFALSFMGFRQAKAGGGKTGLAMAGVIIGLAGVALCAYMLYSVNYIHSQMGDVTKGIEEGFDKVKDAMQNALDTLKTMGDSMSTH